MSEVDTSAEAVERAALTLEANYRHVGNIVAFIRALAAERDDAIAERDKLALELKAAQIFGGGFWGLSVTEGTREWYRMRAGYALPHPRAGEGER